jgi:uroporphyrinogen III methyltransferase/synthase
MATKSAGKVYLVGAGAGDPGLITVRGVECIQCADVVIYDYLANPALLRYARAEAERIYVGKQAGKHTLTQEEINALLVEQASAGKVVTRLKGGDPYVFGRGGEEAEALEKVGIPFEVVPGITSSIAAPSYAGIPVTHRAVATAFMVITGHEDPTKPETQVNWKNVAEFFGTRVILMGVERIGKISAELIGHGASPDTPVAMVRWGTTGQQRTITGTLATIADVAAEAEFKPPAVTIIGEVVRLRETLNWFERRPLFGKRIVVTRSRSQASDLVRQLTDLGAEVLEIPTIRIGPPADPKPLREAVEVMGTYDWLVFTSPNGVDAFFSAFYAMHKDIREIGPVRIAAVGTATAQKVAEHHLEVDFMPKEFTNEAMLKEMKEALDCENLKMLLPRSGLADETLARGLESLGAIVDDLDAYTTVPETEDVNGHRARLLEEGADLVTFTSSSTVNNFCRIVDIEDLKKRFPLMRFVSIGPQTTKAAVENKLDVALEAEVHTIPGLVDAILGLVAQKRKRAKGKA